MAASKKKPKSALSDRALKAGRPASTHPYRLLRKYGEPVLFERVTAVRKQLLADLDDCLETAERIGSLGDRIRINEARELADKVNDETPWPFVLDVVIDEHTGVRYQVEVTKR